MRNATAGRRERIRVERLGLRHGAGRVLGAMADDDDKGNKGGTGGGSTGLTQADVDRIVADRLAREKAKYADYDDLKKKAAQADAQKSDVDKLTDAVRGLTERAEKAERETLRRDVADRFKLPKTFAGKLSGTTKEDLEREAAEVVAELKALGVDLDKAGGKANAGDGGTDGGKAGDGAGDGDGKGGSAGGESVGGLSGGKSTDTANMPLGRARPREDLKPGATPGGDAGTKVDYGKEAEKIMAGGLLT
jgi:hypothetical protein